LKSINPLIAYWHSVDLPQVTEPLKSIPCDQVHISYFPYPYPHRIAENFFHAHKEYTHLLLIPNDLIVTKDHYNMMLEFVSKYDLAVGAGVCNVDTAKYENHLNVCLRLPEISYQTRRYRWLAESQRLDLLRRGIDFLQVEFAGFPFMWVRRDVLEKTRINWLESQTNESPIWESNGGYSNDLAFCHNLKKHDIPIVVNLRCKMLHLRYAGEQQIGKKAPKVKYFKYDSTTKRHVKIQPRGKI
jgi:hypothetical protein